MNYIKEAESLSQIVQVYANSKLLVKFIFYFTFLELFVFKNKQEEEVNLNTITILICKKIFVLFNGN